MKPAIANNKPAEAALKEGEEYFFCPSAQFGYSESVLLRVQAFHFKGGQGANTGTGGQLPGAINKGKISEVRGIPEGIRIVFKLSANHIEQDIQFSLDASADYIVDKSSLPLRNFFDACTDLMQLMARACGHDSLSQFNKNDLATWHRAMAHLTGVAYSGFADPAMS